MILYFHNFRSIIINTLKIILASSSKYRKTLLQRLNIPFECHSPNIDETPKNQEQPEALATRLAEQKAQAIAGDYPNALIIGSDQTIVCDHQLFGKPNNHDEAYQQLNFMSGKSVMVFTAMCLHNTALATIVTDIVPTEVRFRTLKLQSIERYLSAEQPYECAGSLKSEGLGITLLDEIKTTDPTALIGLPLIKLTTLLHEAGVQLP